MTRKLLKLEITLTDLLDELLRDSRIGPDQGESLQDAIDVLQRLRRTIAQ